MELYRQRRNRTVVITYPPGSALNRADILSAVVPKVGRSRIVAFGQLGASRWECILSDDEAGKELVDNMITIKGIEVTFQGFCRQPRRLRIKQIPTCIPNEYVRELLHRRNIKVISIAYEIDPIDGIMTNTRVAVVDAEDWDIIPDVMPWSFDGFRGSALLFLAGRPPRCHRCQERGHKAAECPYPYCRICRTAGHNTSDVDCQRKRSTYAGRVAGVTGNVEHSEEQVLELDDAEKSQYVDQE